MPQSQVNVDFELIEDPTKYVITIFAPPGYTFISEVELKTLKVRATMMDAYEAAGVDNWESDGMVSKYMDEVFGKDGW